MSESFRTFEEFWPHYVREHARPATRRLHFVGTATALACVAAFVRTRRLWLLPAAAVTGYGPAWLSHFLVEKNRPATFRHPLWSLRADLRMFRLMCQGAMDAEVARATRAEARPTNGAGRADAGDPDATPPTDRSTN